jgi:hypothetical protein
VLVIVATSPRTVAAGALAIVLRSTAMRSVVVLVSSLLVGCGGGGGSPNDANNDPDGPPSVSCQEATTYQDIANIESKIFKTSCVFSGCHNGGATPAGQLDLREGMAHAHLVDIASEIETDRKLVVAGNPAASYLLLILGEIAPGDAQPPGSLPPANIGLMPQNSPSLLCNEKREAIARWIEAGAPAN